RVRRGPPPGGFGGGFGRGRGPRGGGLTADQIVERLMSFDKNKDGKLSKDELPERMQDLFTKGDLNKDGFLDKDEIKKLAEARARAGSFPGRGGRGGPGGRFGPGGPGRSLEQVVDDLKLADKKKETATAACKTYNENVRKLRTLARAELVLKLTDVLSED